MALRRQHECQDLCADSLHLSRIHRSAAHRPPLGHLLAHLDTGFPLGINLAGLVEDNALNKKGTAADAKRQPGTEKAGDQAGRWLRRYRATAQAAAADIQKSPKKPIGDAPLESKPAGTASINTKGMARFQSTEAASRMGSVNRSAGACPGTFSAEYWSCGRPHLGQKQFSASMAWWQRVQVISIHL